MATVEKIRSSRTSADERTPTDLKQKNVAAVEKAINAIVADAFALYVKTKNFHWHMSGPNFRDFHILLDEQAAAIYDSIDPLAERVRKIGGKTITSIGHIAKLQSIKDNDAAHVDPYDMLNELMEDNKAVTKALREAHSVCDENDDVGTAALLEEQIDKAERRTWFLFEACRSAGSNGH